MSFASILMVLVSPFFFHILQFSFDFLHGFILTLYKKIVLVHHLPQKVHHSVIIVTLAYWLMVENN